MNAPTVAQTPAATVLVSCQNVARTFGRGAGAVVAVHGTSCLVRAHDRIAVMGPSGSGKSTLLHLMAGLERPTGGTVTWPGFTIDGGLRARDIGVVFQSPSLINNLDVAENAGLPLVLAGRPEGEARRRALEALDLVGAGDLMGKLPQELSGGQAQRVAIARVLALRPRLMLADEPTGQLDRVTGRHIVDVLLGVADRIGAALVVSTHDPSVGERFPARWTMSEGRLTVPFDSGPPTAGDTCRGDTP
ncbi:ABC transporter ATP-binding protein [Streptomyces sp. SID13666]|uniref:ABC transporter ATP-binding protein n=1 Tax=unclassified Streptomyces TaxID=2593676 RepID=UPI0013C15D66|nr:MULTISPECIES: ABC transporter ATP-binding protein [unclassified Streptomyces]NEA54226.1 ABC transporter ATP-binding protein [Streptomyces sp. SID13666]NEA70321.1 ABC transporter ATP-binding protein [Streptomyces sp. SID13588]